MLCGPVRRLHTVSLIVRKHRPFLRLVFRGNRFGVGPSRETCQRPAASVFTQFARYVLWLGLAQRTAVENRLFVVETGYRGLFI